MSFFALRSTWQNSNTSLIFSQLLMLIKRKSNDGPYPTLEKQVSNGWFQGNRTSPYPATIDKTLSEQLEAQPAPLSGFGKPGVNTFPEAFSKTHWQGKSTLPF